MKTLKSHWIYLSIGFVLGAVYIVSCGGGANTIAQTAVEAIDVFFDNSASGLNADNMQEAIDELAARPLGQITQNQVAGTWNGKVEGAYEITNNVSLTLNSDGTFSCIASGNFNNSQFDFFPTACANPIEWTISNRVIRIKYTPSQVGASGLIHIPIHFMDSTSMTILGSGSGGEYILELTKS